MSHLEERSALLPENTEVEKKTLTSAGRTVFNLALVVISTVAAIGAINLSTRKSSDSSTFLLTADVVAPTITLSNSYERRDGIVLGEGFYNDWGHLAEIYRSTRVEASTTVDDCLYGWTKVDTHGTETFTGYGDHVEMIFESIGWNGISLLIKCPSTEVTATYPVMVKYVRREIRLLNQSDRSTFFDTLYTTYTTEQVDGERAYGKKFRSIKRLVSEHLLGAADKECDHWHDDAGIMTHHIAFTLEMEQSLQSIDKTVTIPYWDYTQDAYELDDWTDSDIFNPDWFGMASPSSKDHVITEGRWAYLSVGKQADKDGVRNPYGLLRSPWNTNPTPYVLRHRYVYDEKDGGWTLPGCTDFSSAWSYNSLGEYFDELNGELHGPVHIMIGGQWWVNRTMNFSATNGGDFLLASKFLWRQGYVRCPELCSDDTPDDRCTCSCPDELTRYFRTSRDFLDETGLFNLSDGLFSDWSNFATTGCMTPDDCFDTVVKALCHVGHAGEMFTSAAPYDPTFWPIHGLADRYLSLKRIQAHENETLLSQTWSYDHDGNSPSDTRRVCDWSKVGDTMGLPDCYVGDCAGHRAQDLLPMGNFLDRNESYTNEEFYKFMNPRNEELPYIYDSFTQWPACTDQAICWWNTDGAC